MLDHRKQPHSNKFNKKLKGTISLYHQMAKKKNSLKISMELDNF